VSDAGAEDADTDAGVAPLEGVAAPLRLGVAEGPPFGVSKPFGVARGVLRAGVAVHI
jgi:hypothetical protein